MMNYRETLERYKRLYLDDDYKVTGKYWKQAKKVEGDVDYLEKHADRTKKSNRFDYMVIPTNNRHIIGGLIAMIFLQKRYFRKEEEILQVLQIIDITKRIIENLRANNYEGEPLNALITWAKVFERFLNINLYENLHHFVGCNYGVKKIKESWDDNATSM